MRYYKVTFYKHETTAKGQKETNLGFIVIDGNLNKDCSTLTAKAFRQGSSVQQTATGVKIEEI